MVSLVKAEPFSDFIIRTFSLSKVSNSQVLAPFNET